MGKPRHRDARQAPAAEPHVERGELLQVVADRARMLTGGQASAVCVLDAPNERIRVAAGSGQFADRIGDEASAGQGLSRHVVLSSGPLLC